jgi:hypothetical protein
MERTRVTMNNLAGVKKHSLYAQSKCLFYG